MSEVPLGSVDRCLGPPETQAQTQSLFYCADIRRSRLLVVYK